jgi:CNT family concentrative nucleoside transporter
MTTREDSNTNLQGIVGIIFLTGLAWLISENRRAVRYQIILTGLVVQFSLALIMLKIPFFRDLFNLLNDGVMAIQQATTAGTSSSRRSSAHRRAS